MSRTRNNGLSNPRIPDPVAFRVKRWTEPNDEQVREITAALMGFVTPQAINFTGVFIHVEVERDGREYARHSLSGRVAGISTLISSRSWRFLVKNVGSCPAKVSGPREQDRSNYLKYGLGLLQPGVCLGLSPTTSAGNFSDSRLCTTDGVCLRNPLGNVVIVAANHGFPDSDEVFHPTTVTEEMIGEIKERWVAQDVAMVELRPSIEFSNREYFNATPPRRLLRLSQSSYGQWCTADGMSCGTIFLQREGRRVSEPRYQFEEMATTGIMIPVLRFHQEALYSALGPVGGEVSEGICGTPIVEEDTRSAEQDRGGVCEFFRMASDTMAVCSCLDEIIDRSWELY